MKISFCFRSLKDKLVKSFSKYDLFLLLVLLALFTMSEIEVSDFKEYTIGKWFFVLCKSFFTWTLFFSVPLWFLGKYSRFIYCPLLIIFFVLNVAIFITYQVYNFQLDGDIVGIILGSSPSEMKSFLGSFIHWSILPYLIAFVFVIWAIVKINIQLKCKPSRFRAIIGVFSIVLFLSVHSFFRESIFSFDKSHFCGLIPSVHLRIDTIPVMHLIRDSIVSFKNFNTFSIMKKHPTLPKNLTKRFTETQSVGVVVLGESATRNHWSLYGYPRETTPCLSAKRNEIYAFLDTVAPFYSTAECLPLIFTQASIASGQTSMNCTIAQVLENVGFNTALFTNQSRWGFIDSVESFVFSGCDKQFYMNEEFPNSQQIYDDQLLSFLADDVKRNYSSTNSVYFLHFMGSHMEPEQFYPHEIAPFKSDSQSKDNLTNTPSRIDHYDNSIWFSDKVLGEIITICENINIPSWVIYISDHGETPSADSWRKHNDNDLWEIPFVVWFSKEYRDLHPDIVQKVEKVTKLPLQSDQLYWGILEIAGVDCDEIRSINNFLSPDFTPREKRTLDGRIYEK